MINQYIVELRGCHFKNKGDVLMAEAVIGKLRVTRPDIRLVARTMNRRGALADPASLGRCISPNYSSPRSGLKALFLKSLMISPLVDILDRFAGVVPAQKIAAVIDICGFSYGDAWGASAIEADYRYFSELVSAGKPLVLMPKSFGPFSSPETAKKMKMICEMADLCFARDSQSLENLISIGVSEQRITRYPDFTASAKALPSTKHDGLAGRPAIVPNYRMVDAGKVFSEDQYVSFLVELYRQLDTFYGKPFILVHDTGRDPLLAKAISLGLGESVEIVDEPIAVVNKSIIARASFVYSDRLHGAISAALQGVPVCAMGWSHKYRYMLADFGLEWALVKPGTVFNLLEQVRKVCDRYQSRVLCAGRVNQTEQLADILRLNDLMWTEIFDCLVMKLPRG